ncbi:MAG TPA: tripartite tricarboxylate transporter TctB family protein [Burkholderiales bacterium]|nr:tripartite tricarboxylate transporter TctB family protein [Burkholderiales bacterium]
MDEHGQLQEEQKSGPSMMAIEAIVALLILLFGATIVFDSVSIGYRWAEDGPQAGYFPFYIGVIICIAAAITLYQALFGSLRSKEIFVEWGQLKDVLSVLIPAAIYVFGIQVIGIYIASAIYIALFMMLLGKYSLIKGLATGIGVAAVFFTLFEIWFKLPLYKGWFNLLAFTGY